MVCLSWLCSQPHGAFVCHASFGHGSPPPVVVPSSSVSPVARQSKRPKPRKIPRDECRILWLCAVIAGTVTAILYSSWPANNGPIQHLTPLYILDLDSGADLGRHTCRVSETKSTLPSRPTSWETQCGMVLPHDPLGIRRSPKQRIGPLDPVMEIPMAHRMCHLCGRT